MADRADAPDPGATTEQPHRHEQPEDWGWNGAWGKWARIGGWISVVVLLLLNVTTYYNTAQAPWLYGTIAVLVLLLVRDRYRRKNAWRDE
ncbi:MAG TPA: hypothetical protein VH573_00750 [Mycobacteriales bacterium]